MLIKLITRCEQWCEPSAGTLSSLSRNLALAQEPRTKNPGVMGSNVMCFQESGELEVRSVPHVQPA